MVFISVTTLQPTFKVSVLKTETWLPASTTDFDFEIDYTTTTETVVLPSKQVIFHLQAINSIQSS